MVDVGIVGASGYVGGELLRLLLQHPLVNVVQATSRRYAGSYVSNVHPNLRGQTTLKFIAPDDVEACDLLLLALPHGTVAGAIGDYTALAERLIDCSSDFRLDSPQQYERWYGKEHAAPGWLPRFVYGLPEVYRESLRGTHYASGVGCNATAVNLALLPLARQGLIDRAIVDLKVGSSEAGNRESAASHHPERSGAMRSFAPTGHRHTAEVLQALGPLELFFSVTAVEMVRGVLCTAHLFLNEQLAEKDLWRLFRQQYRDEPFVRIVKERKGIYRYPEPKILAGSNYCDVGFAVEEDGRRVVVISALDNLMKGAAGSAVQSMNLMLNFDETAGLTFPGLHPI